MGRRDNELVIRAVKVLDIGFVTTVYFVLAVALALTVDEMLGPFDAADADRKTLFRITVELILHTWFVGVTIYVVRNLVERVPFPLDGVAGYQHGRLKELANAAVFSGGFIIFQTHLKSKIEYLRQRLVRVIRARAA